MSTVRVVGSETFDTQVPNKLIPQVGTHTLKTSTRLLELLFFTGKMQAFLKGALVSELRAAIARFKLTHKRCKQKKITYEQKR